jgi:hypothetical protein
MIVLVRWGLRRATWQPDLSAPYNAGITIALSASFRTVLRLPF